jgi:hypothetical protein
VAGSVLQGRSISIRKDKRSKVLNTKNDEKYSNNTKDDQNPIKQDITKSVRNVKLSKLFKHKK